MMVLTKRVGDSPESQTPSLHVRKYQFFMFSACSIFAHTCRRLLFDVFRWRLNQESGRPSVQHLLRIPSFHLRRRRPQLDRQLLKRTKDPFCRQLSIKNSKSAEVQVQESPQLLLLKKQGQVHRLQEASLAHYPAPPAGVSKVHNR